MSIPLIARFAEMRNFDKTCPVYFSDMIGCHSSLPHPGGSPAGRVALNSGENKSTVPVALWGAHIRRGISPGSVAMRSAAKEE